MEFLLLIAVMERLCGGDEDIDYAASSLLIKLICPISRKRVEIAVRSSKCTHSECFDAESYLSLNSLSPKFVCPICNKPAPVDQLVLDGLVHNLMNVFLVFFKKTY